MTVAMCIPGIVSIPISLQKSANHSIANLALRDHSHKIADDTSAANYVSKRIINLSNLII